MTGGGGKVVGSAGGAAIGGGATGVAGTVGAGATGGGGGTDAFAECEAALTRVLDLWLAAAPAMLTRTTRMPAPMTSPRRSASFFPAGSTEGASAHGLGSSRSTLNAPSSPVLHTYPLDPRRGSKG